MTVLGRRQQIAVIKQLWRHLNATVWRSYFVMLPEFDVRPFKSIYGRYYPERNRICVAQAFFDGTPGYSLAELLATLNHEMVHIYQFQHGAPLRHGKTFRAMCDALGFPE